MNEFVVGGRDSSLGRKGHRVISIGRRKSWLGFHHDVAARLGAARALALEHQTDAAIAEAPALARALAHASPDLLIVGIRLAPHGLRIDANQPAGAASRQPMRELRHVVHGKRSEQLTADERRLTFEDLEGGAAGVEAEAQAGDSSPARLQKRPRADRDIGHLPEHLEYIEQVIEPQSRLCSCNWGRYREGTQALTPPAETQSTKAGRVADHV